MPGPRRRSDGAEDVETLDELFGSVDVPRPAPPTAPAAPATTDNEG